MLVLQLSQENLPLARAEALALCPAKNELVGEFLLIDAPYTEALQRLAFTRSSGELLFTCNIDDVLSAAEAFDWNSHVKGTYAVDAVHCDLGKDIADRIWRRIPNPKVDLHCPDIRIIIAFAEGNTLCMVQRWQQDEDFQGRRPHLRPAHHPSSMSPKLARAMVNLTGIQEGRIVDPFCGSGGLLIEAGLLGLSCTGYDIDAAMIGRARTNLVSFGIAAALEVKDSLTLDEPADYVVTDIPYGRSTKTSPQLAARFFALLGGILRKRAVVMLPSTIDAQHLAEKSGLRLVQQFSWYVHKGLTRKIFVLEPIEEPSIPASHSRSAIE